MQSATWFDRLRNAFGAWTGIGGGHQALYVTSDALFALRQHRDGWHLAARFALGQTAESEALAGSAAASSPVPEEFRRWISRWRGDRFLFLLDSADEEIEIDELPNVRGRDREKVVERRLKQRFRDAALTTWRMSAHGARTRPRTGPRECTLLVGLRQRNPMLSWIESALACGARISAVESLALRSAPLLRASGAGASAMLASVQPGGLRQTLVHNGEACFTRLQPLEPGASWQRAAEELDRTVRFLMMSRAALRPLIQSGKVPIFVIGEGLTAPAGLAPASELPLREAPVPITWIGLPVPARRGAAAGEGAQLGGLLQFLSTRRQASAGYETAPMRAHARAARGMAAGWSVAGTLLLLAVGANLFIHYTQSDHLNAVDARARQAVIDATRAQAQELERQLSAQAVSAEEMDAVVRLAAQLQSRHVPAPGTLRWIGQALTRDPNINLDDISWEPVQALGGAPAATGGGSAVPGGAPPAPAAATAASATLVRLSGTVDATISKELANGKVAALFERLKSGCNCTGRIVASPYDPSMDVAYAASLRDGVRGQAPRFTIEIEQAAPAGTAAAQSTGHLSQNGGDHHG